MYSLTKVYIIYCVLAQIQNVEKIWFLSMDQNALSQSDCGIFESTISLEQNDEKAAFSAF